MRLLMFGQLIEERGVHPRAAGIIQLPRAALRDSPLDHAIDRRDADAACQQHHHLRIFLQREIVAGRHDENLRTNAQLIVHVERSAPAVRIALYADGVFRKLRRRMDKGILPLNSVCQDDADMRTRLGARQWAAVGTRERVEVRVPRRHAHGNEHHLDRFGRDIGTFRQAVFLAVIWAGTFCRAAALCSSLYDGV